MKKIHRYYYIATFKDESSILVYTQQVLSAKMIKTKIADMGYDFNCMLKETNKASDLIEYHGYTFNIDDVYDENQGEGGFEI